MLTRAQTRTPDLADFSGWLPAGPAYIAPSVTFNWTMTDNVFRVPASGSPANGAKPESSLLLEVTPEVRLALPYSRSQLELDFKPGYRDYSRVELSEHISQDLTLRNSLVLSNGMEIETGVNRSSGTFERNDFDRAGQINFSTTPYRTAEGTLSWTWTHPSHWGTILSLEGRDYTFDNETGRAAPGAAVELLFDNKSSSASLDVEWIVQPRFSLFAGLGITRERVDVIGEDLDCRRGGVLVDCDRDGVIETPNGRLDPAEEGRSFGGDLLHRSDRFQQDDLRVGLRGQIGPRLFADGTLAQSTLSSRDSGEEQFGGITTRLDTRFHLTRTSDLTLQYDRQPQQTLTSRSEVFVYRSVHAGWLMTGLRNSFTAGIRSITSRLPDRREDYLFVDASWSLRIRRWATVRVAATRAVKGSSIPAFEYDETRATVGWAVGWF
jgi:hypothetical protein